MEKPLPLKAASELASSHLVTTGAAFAALFLFVPLAHRVTVSTFSGLPPSPADQQLGVACLLNVAVILFAWRRSKDLKQAMAVSEDARKSAHENAYSDHVTGLPNRRELMRLLSEPHLSDEDGKLVLLDLDFFKKVNDLYGHVVGDEVLREAARIIRTNAPDGSCCARLGGDEFAILVRGHNDALVNQAVFAIVHAIAQPLSLKTATVHVSASAGISRIEPQMSAEDCLRRSDIAMYAAKRTGRNCQIWFDEKMERELLERTQLENEIRLGIARQEFVPFYQPQIDLHSGELIGFEVLARWHSPTRGLVEPAQFLEVAEASGLIFELSLAVMKQALTEAREWDSDLKIAVNVSPVQFRDSQLAERILKILVETSFPASRLELEITEASFLEDRESALTIVESLKNMGVTISLDDFGTGYASLSQLHSLPFDRIKIDKSFVASLLEDSQSDAFVSTILSLGRALKLPITAEGIEDGPTKERLSRLGCSDGQGWLFGKAVPGAAIRATLRLDDNGQSQDTQPPPPAEPPLERRDRRRRAGGGKDHPLG